MSRRKGAANLQFFADDKFSLFAYDFQTHNSTTVTALNGDEVENFSELQSGALFNQRSYLLLGEAYVPSIEIFRLAIIIFEYLRENLWIGRAAKCFGTGVHPLLRLFFLREIGDGEGALVVLSRVPCRNQIGLIVVVPTSGEFLGHSTATFRKTCIADLIAIGENLPACGDYCLAHFGTRHDGDALIALAVIVCTNIEERMVFSVIPANVFVVLSLEREEVAFRILGMPTALLHHFEQPTATHHGMGFE